MLSLAHCGSHAQAPAASESTRFLQCGLNEPGTSLKRTIGALVVRSHCMDDQFTGTRTPQTWSSELGVSDGEQDEEAWSRVLKVLAMMPREPYRSCMSIRSAFWQVLPQ